MKTENNLLIEINPARVVKYNMTMARVNLIKEHASWLSVDGVKDHKGLRKVVKTRKFIKSIRRTVEVRRKDLNADMLREMRENNFAARFIINELKPTEKFLNNIEKEIANEKTAIKLEKQRIALERLQKRIDALAGFDIAVDIASIKDLSDEQFAVLLTKTQIEYHERKVQKEIEAKKLSDDIQRLKDENALLKQAVPAPDLPVQAEVPAAHSNASHEAVAPANEQIKEVAPSPEEMQTIKKLVKEYALALKAVPVPVITNDQARIILINAQVHINNGINMLLKAVE